MGKIKKSPTKLPVPKYNLRTRNPPQPNQTSKNQNSKSPIHKCNLCGLHFLHAARLNAHNISTHQQNQKTENDQKNDKCYSCDKTFTSSVKLKIHIYNVHEQKRKTVRVTYGNITPNILDLEKNCDITTVDQKDHKRSHNS